MRRDNNKKVFPLNKTAVDDSRKHFSSYNFHRINRKERPQSHYETSKDVDNVKRHHASNEHSRPVMTLFNPTTVPRHGRYFESKRQRNQVFADDDYKNGPSRSADSDNVWLHDKFEMLQKEECKEENLAQIYGQQLFGQTSFNCLRINPRYCCSSRVRFSCAQLCLQNPCNTPPSIQYYMPVSSSLRKNNRPRQEIIPNLKNARHEQPFGVILPIHDTDRTHEIFESKSIDFENIEENKQSQQMSFVSNFDPMPISTDSSDISVWKTAGSTPFPTLIPWNVTAFPSSLPHAKNNRIGAKRSNTMDSDADVSDSHNSGFENGRVKLSGALIPPSPLSTDYDRLEILTAEDVETKNDNKSLSSFTAYTSLASPAETNNSTVQHIPPLPANPGNTWIPLRFNVKPSILNSSRTTLADSGALTTTTETFSTSVISKNDGNELSIYSDEDASKMGEMGNGANQKSIRKISSLSFSSLLMRRGDLPMPVEENFQSKLGPSVMEKAWSRKENNTITNNGAAVDENVGLFGNKINIIIDHLITQRTIDAISALTGKKPKAINNEHKQNLSLTTTPYTGLSSISANLMGVQSNKQCGTAPDYRPCVEKQVANNILLSCCKHKLMPFGCLELCRYDITQAEIKKAFGAGKCGVLNVAPYLECASQGENNLGCCRQYNIAKNSGNQCEVFCNPGKGLGPLGLQHLACQNVIGDLLKCHHAGLRSNANTN